VHKAKGISNEIIKFSEETKHKNVFLCPFAHLSNNLANSEDALTILEAIVEGLKNLDVQLTQGHFGSDKELLIHLYGHPGNARYREF
jgi:threonyl-tRNA synthetase